MESRLEKGRGPVTNSGSGWHLNKGDILVAGGEFGRFAQCLTLLIVVWIRQGPQTL